jgi:hypothetical protein
LIEEKDGVPEPVPMWRQKRQKEDDPFFEHTILLELRVGRYIDHFICSKDGCLILNPASHLILHDNLQCGYFKKIKFIIKLTYTKSCLLWWDGSFDLFQRRLKSLHVNLAYIGFPK